MLKNKINKTNGWITLLLFTILFFDKMLAQTSSISYEITAEFFPSDAKMWGYSVSNNSYMRAHAKVFINSDEFNSKDFFLHGELKIDSIKCEGRKISYDTEKIFYEEDYSNIALQVKVDNIISKNSALDIYYSGFFNPSKSRSLSDYMRVNKNEGVYLRGYGYSLWFPIFKNKENDAYYAFFREVHVTLLDDFKSIVGGRLISESVINGKYIATWQPGYINVLDIQISAAKYKKREKKMLLFIT